MAETDTTNPAPAELPTIEEHAQALGTDAFTMAGTKTLHGWGIGKRCSREDFVAACEAFLGVKLSSGDLVRIK